MKPRLHTHTNMGWGFLL